MTTTTFPPDATRPDLFGIVHAALLPALKDADVRVVWFAEEASVVLVSTPFLLLRTVASEALLARHPVEVSPTRSRSRSRQLRGSGSRARPLAAAGHTHAGRRRGPAGAPMPDRPG